MLMHMYMCMYMYIYIYIHIPRIIPPEEARPRGRRRADK